MAASHSLTNPEIARFSRQLLIEEIGVHGQERLRDSSVLIVGAGGLGCPVAAYLAAAGVGRIGLVDHDSVAVDNLHRQLLHSENSIGTSKVISAKKAIGSLNSSVNVAAHDFLLDRNNALHLIAGYDIIADCSDNVPTRYLVNDACVILDKPLVSGSALRWEGQLTIYNNGKLCPCYRCLFPTAPPPETVTSCSEGGVVGPIVGVIGSMQALEVIKLIVGLPTSFTQCLFLFDGLCGQTRTVKLRERRVECVMCGVAARAQQNRELPDYEAFCGTNACDKVACVRLLPESDRISVTAYKELQSRNDASLSPMLIDTRPRHEFEIAHLPEAKNITLAELKKMTPGELANELRTDSSNANNVFVVCHRGNDSQLAVAAMREKLNALADEGGTPREGNLVIIRDLIGGLDKWAELVDMNFPRY